MKLYTEEQVIKALELSKTVGWGEKGTEYIYSDKEILERLTPIELPSYDEITQQASRIYGRNYPYFEDYEEGFYDGAKWMRDKILNK